MLLQEIFYHGIVFAMERHKKKRKKTTRSDAATALVRLRELLGKTQQEFAALSETAISTIGRWESYDPPRGEALLRLAEVAEQSGLGRPAKEGIPFMEMSVRFYKLYLDEVRENVKGNQIIGFAGSDEAYLFVKLKGPAQLAAGQEFIFKLGGISSC
jgi:transcriptional regulator with XRE-family HTH domain